MLGIAGNANFISKNVIMLNFIPFNAVNLDFCSPGHSNRFKDQWLHVKTAPYTIVAQVINGCYEISCNGQEAIIHPGEAFLTPANCEMKILHLFGPKPDCYFFESQWLHFHFTVFASIDLTSLFDLPLKIGKEYQERIDTCIKKAMEIQKSAAPLAKAVILNSKALELLEIILAISKPHQARMQQLQTSTRFLPVFDLLRKKFNSPITAKDMAQRANMSLAHFHHLFQANMGCSPMNYLKKIRLEQAEIYLLNSDLSLTQIAELTGFSNQFHFCREFKNKTGLPPSVYRQRNRW